MHSRAVRANLDDVPSSLPKGSRECFRAAAPMTLRDDEVDTDVDVDVEEGSYPAMTNAM